MALKGFEKLDREFEQLLLDVLHDVDKKEFTPSRRAERRKLADASEMEFARIYFPHIFNLPFNDVHRYLANLQSGFKTISGFPKSGKTAFTFIGKIVKSLVSGTGGIINVTLRTQEIAKERTFHIFRLITNNKLLNYDYEIRIQQEAKGYYIINNTILVATSVETGLRNFVDDNFKRFKISVADDTYNRISASSDNDNEKTTNFLVGELYRQMEDDGLSIVLGNRINESCPIVRLEKKFPDNHFSFPIVNDEGKSNWPERYNDEEISELENRTDWDVWQGEYLDQPAERGDVFQPEWIRSIRVNPETIVASISVIDPAFGKSPSSCDKGIATVGITAKHEVIVQDLYLRQESYEECFSYIDALRVKIPNWKVLLFEDDFAQWTIAEPYYKSWVAEHKKVLPVVKFNSKENKTELRGADKESRIMNLVHPHQTGMMLYNQDINGSLDFIKFLSQYKAFPKAKKKLDGMDALATAYIMIFRYMNTGTFTPTKKRTWQKPEWLGKFL